MIIPILFVIYLLFILLLLYKMDSFDDDFLSQSMTIILILLFSFVSLVFGVIYADPIRNSPTVQKFVGFIVAKAAAAKEKAKSAVSKKQSPYSDVLLTEQDLAELDDFDHLISSPEEAIIDGAGRKSKSNKIKRNIIEDDNRSVTSNDSYYISKY